MEHKTYLARLDAIFEDYADEVSVNPALYKESTFSTSVFLFNKRLDDLNSIRAILMDPHPPQLLVQDHTLHQLECTIQPFVPSKKGQYSALLLLDIMFDQTFDIDNRTYRGLETPRSIFQRWSKPSPKYYPRTGQQGYIDHLVEYLEQVMLVKAKADESVGPLKLYILRLIRMLKLVSGRLVKISHDHKENIDLKNLIQGITNLAYDTEYAIDLYLVREIPIWYSVFWLQDILKVLNVKMGQLNAETGDMNSIVSQILSQMPYELKIIALLNNTGISEKLEETVIATSGYFHICTWSLVSSYKERKKEVFLQLLRNVSSKKGVDKIEYTSDLSEKKLKELVYDLLKTKKYLIILKDVDDIEDFNDITTVFPDKNDYPGSRILLTTPSPELVVHCRSGSQEDHFGKIFEDYTPKSHHTKPNIEDEVFGFETETETMLSGLFREPKQLRIISIFGMAGQGKTTLAKKVYNEVSVVRYFDRRAWGCVSQVYSKRDLLLEILSQVVQLSDTIHVKNDEELAAMLCQSLMGLRFLIVLDDLWSIEAWNDLRRCFPNDKNGSRIIFTTRHNGLASEAQFNSMLQPLNPLSDDESWDLLQKKLFQKEICPPELLEVGKEIARYCEGLPLSVVLTAGLLAKMEKKKDVWEEIGENLSSRIFNDAKVEDKGVIELSYKHLPDHLRPCFLYFGAFLEDREVPVQKLIRLWIAEGFIKHSNSKSVEDVAEDYLLDLIGRSLVMVAQEKSNGGVKSCRVHDLLREFALSKSTEENFLLPMQVYGERNENLLLPIPRYFNEQADSYSKPKTLYRHCLSVVCKLRSDSKSSYSSKPIAEPKSSTSSNPLTYNQRRICIYSDTNDFCKLKVEPPGLLVRSLLFFNASESFNTSIFRNFRLLRILKFENINIGDSFKEIDVLLHLRYLAVKGTMVSVPSSIANLLDLETFCVNSLEDKVVEVPDSIWDIPSLRHLHINGHASFDMEPQRLENLSILDNLQTLSTPSLAYGDNMEKILRKLRGIRKLKCIFLDSWDFARNCNHFPVLDFLNKLESIKIFYNGERRYPCLFNFPSNLKKLTLTNFRMPWNEISQLTNLKNLGVLKLLGNACEDENWEMEGDLVFPKLKFLKLDTLNVTEWIASGDNFPSLKFLVLHKCEQLKEIPPGIGDIPTLLVIEVKWCSPSATVSAMNIREVQLEFGNEGLKVNVHPKVWNSEQSLRKDD